MASKRQEIIDSIKNLLIDAKDNSQCLIEIDHYFDRFEVHSMVREAYAVTKGRKIYGYLSHSIVINTFKEGGATFGTQDWNLYFYVDPSYTHEKMMNMFPETVPIFSDSVFYFMK